ncbi:MAG: tetratricopeptide repeat protein, partial [Candidatus Cloacimonetes bacterium]|nr:tetratricopeptide repeat protein [Candidatus Cloacimonadota bacterium]
NTAPLMKAFDYYIRARESLKATEVDSRAFAIEMDMGVNQINELAYNLDSNLLLTKNYFYNIGVDIYNNEKWQEALTHFEMMIKHYPPDGQLLSIMIFASENLNDSRRFNKYVNMMLKADNPDGGIIGYAAEKYFSQKKYSKSAQYFLKAGEINENPVYYYNAGVCYERIKQTDKALEAFNKTIQTDPTHVDAHISAAKIYDKQGNLETALQLMRKALKLVPDDLENLSWISTALYKQKKCEEALKYAKRWFNMDPGEKDAVIILYQCSKTLGKSEDEMKYAEILERM